MFIPFFGHGIGASRWCVGGIFYTGDVGKSGGEVGEELSPSSLTSIKGLRCHERREVEMVAEEEHGVGVGNGGVRAGVRGVGVEVGIRDREVGGGKVEVGDRGGRGNGVVNRGDGNDTDRVRVVRPKFLDCDGRDGYGCFGIGGFRWGTGLDWDWRYRNRRVATLEVVVRRYRCFRIRGFRC